jgi:predicted aspartyl protease
MRMLHWFVLGALGLALGAGALAMPTGTRLPVDELPGPEANAPADRSGRMRAPVFINGEGPFRFIIDTAANRSAVSARLAQRLALEPRGTGEVHALSGPFIAAFVAVHELNAGAITLRDTELPIVSADVLGDADGLLGVEALDERQLTMDFEHERIVIAAARRRLRPGAWSSVAGEKRFGNLIVAEGRIGGQRVKIVFDTGAQSSIANAALRDALLARGEARTDLTRVRTLTAGPPIVLNQVLFVPRLRVGDVVVNYVTAAVGNAYVFQLWELTEEPALLLGMDVLSQTRAMAIDYRRASVHFLN